MSSFGPSEQQLLADMHAGELDKSAQGLVDRIPTMSRDELARELTSQLEKNSHMAADIKYLREEKIKLTLVLEEEDERRSNLFLKKMEEIENATQVCPKCAFVCPNGIHRRASSIDSPVPE
jgi:hypothetical protein